MTRLPRLHAITDDARLADGRFLEDAAAVLEAGAAEVALHVRGRATSAARLYELTVALRGIARTTGSLVLVNDRVDVALAARADGAQLREDSMGVAAARALLGSDALIGVSRHAGSASRAEDADADFIVLGHVFETTSHAGALPLGAVGVRDQASASAVPLIAIGGITPERVGEVLAAGAYGVAALSGVWAASAPAARVEQYLRALRGLAGPDA